MAVATPTGGRGIWRTIRGAKVYLAPGQTPAEAFAASGRGAAARAGVRPGPSDERLAKLESTLGRKAPQSRPRYTGEVQFRGLSEYREAFIREECKKAGFDLEEVVAAGVPDPKMFPEVQVRWMRGAKTVAVEGYSPSGAAMERHFDLATKTIYNEFFRVGEERKGLGTELFARQVENASALGFETMVTHAARAPNLNGYYTWPRLGYDGEIGQVNLKSEVTPPGGAKRVGDLMKTPEGRAWWKENGRSIGLSFDLKAGSQSRRVLEAYVAEKKRMA